MEKRITGRTGMFCLIGTPVGHSGSPAMYNYSFAQTGLDYAYLAYDVPLEKTEEAVNALKVLGCKGFNVTMPCKTRVAELVDELSDAAKLIGACNTVVVKDGKLYGNNTDGMGFVRNLKENGVDVKGKKITVMGAGGAATAIQVQCALDGAKKISIFNRKDEFYANGEKTVKKIQQMVPLFHLQNSRCSGLLCINQHLLVKGAFVAVAGRTKKRFPCLRCFCYG